MKNPSSTPVVWAILSAFLLLCGFSNISLKDIQTAIIEKDYPKAEKMAAAYMRGHHRSEQKAQALYYEGLSQLYRGKTRRARSTFEKLAARHPSEELADRARLGIIDSYYLAGNYKKALSLSRGLLKRRPGSPYLSLIYLKIARADLRLTRWDQARSYLEKIVKQFPHTPEYATARQLLEEKEYFAVQVGSFLHRQHAARLVDELKAKGQYAYIVETTDRAGRHFYRVRIGQLTRLKDARKLKTRLSGLGYPTRIYP